MNNSVRAILLFMVMCDIWIVVINAYVTPQVAVTPVNLQQNTAIKPKFQFYEHGCFDAKQGGYYVVRCV